MKLRIGIRRTACLYVAVCLGCLEVECSRKPSVDSLKMKSLGAKLKAYVIEKLDDYNLEGAENMAIASCFFAREMECVAGKEPRLTANASDKQEKEMGLVAWEKVRSRIERIVLKADIPISGMSEAGYKTILAWAFSEEDMKTLEGIRKKHGYWLELRTALAR